MITKDMGIKDAIVNIGGDLKAIGTKPKNQSWNIGIRHPREEKDYLACLNLTDKAIVSSGDYERFFIKDGIRYHHILNPKDGYPARACQSVTIVTSEAMIGDILATGIFVLGPKKGMKLIETVEHI